MLKKRMTMPARGLYNKMAMACYGGEAASLMVRSMLKHPRMAEQPEETRRSRPMGRNMLLSPMKKDEGGHRGGPRFTPQINVVIGFGGGKPLTNFL